MTAMDKKVVELIEKHLSGDIREEFELYHHSVERKLRAVEIFFDNVESMLIPNIIQSFQAQASASSSGDKVLDSIDFESTINKIGAYIDAFFMSAKSSLDTFAHELRMLYGFGKHSGDLYFEDALNMMKKHHNDSNLYLYLSSFDVKTSSWYIDLNSYRRASAHESIIPIRPSFDVDIITGIPRWKEPILKLPIDPSKKPPKYNGKNFIVVGKLIKGELRQFIASCYDKVFADIESCKTELFMS